MKLSKFSLLGAFMLLAGCSDDLDFHPAKTGENIQFGTKAYFANADTKSSRTEYGDVNEDKNAIELKWVKGDKILIACPQVSQPVSGAVEYQVNEQHAITDGTYNEKDEATSLSPTSMPGLQWGDVTTAHNFYGIYPSANDVNQFALDQVADGRHTTFTGVLPQSQDPKEIDKTTDGYVVAKPNMDYAYMVAQTTNKVGPEGVVSKDVVLTFEPIVTALQFDIIAKQVSNEGSAVTINSINLYSQTKNISGGFTCDFNTKSVTVPDENGAKNVNMFFKDGVTLKVNDHLNFTLFFLSNGAETLNDMKVTFNYTTNNVVKTKTATIGKDIVAKVKHYFKGINFEAIEGEKAAGSNWFSLVEDAAYLNQLSIPIAGNPFSYQSTTNKQQEKDYVSLWNLGVRGFELPTDRAATTATDASLDDKNFVVGESEVSGLTLGEALTKLKELQGLPGSNQEPLILVFRYYPVSEKYNPREYLKQVVQTLKNAGLFDKLVKVDNQSTALDLKGQVVAFVRLGDDAYIRMARIEKTITDFTSCNDLVPNGFEMGNIMFIKDWGNAYDCWDRRYPNVERQSNWTETYSSGMPNGVSYDGYTIQDHAAGHIYKGSGIANGQTYQLTKSGISRIEDLLCGVSSQSSPYNAVGGNYLNFGSEPARLTDHNLMFKHDIHGGGTAYVQEWSRVIYNDTEATSTDVRSIGQNTYTGFAENGNHYLFAKWWKSIDQKKSQIDALFEDAITNTAASLFVNVLSGYYAVATEKTSMIPCKRWIATPETYRYSFQTMNYALVPSGQGKGGDFSALARDLNTYVYNKLRTDAYGIGPWGFIQLDYIGASAKSFSTNYPNEYSVEDAVNASANIVPLIVANNFRFIKNTKPKEEEPVNAPLVSTDLADMKIGMQ